MRLVSWFGGYGVYRPFSDGRVGFIVLCLFSEASSHSMQSIGASIRPTEASARHKAAGPQEHCEMCELRAGNPHTECWLFKTINQGQCWSSPASRFYQTERRSLGALKRSKLSLIGRVQADPHLHSQTRMVRKDDV